MTILVYEVTVLYETEGFALGIDHGETECGGRVCHNDFVDFQFTRSYFCIDHYLGGLDSLVNFRLSQHTYKGEQCCDDCTFHIHFVFYD